MINIFKTHLHGELPVIPTHRPQEWARSQTYSMYLRISPISPHTPRIKSIWEVTKLGHNPGSIEVLALILVVFQTDRERYQQALE